MSFKWLWSLGSQNDGGCHVAIIEKYDQLFIDNRLPFFNLPLSEIWQGTFSIINTEDQLSTTLKNCCYHKVDNGKDFGF